MEAIQYADSMPIPTQRLSIDVTVAGASRVIVKTLATSVTVRMNLLRPAESESADPESSNHISRLLPAPTPNQQDLSESHPFRARPPTSAPEGRTRPVQRPLLAADNPIHDELDAVISTVGSDLLLRVSSRT